MGTLMKMMTGVLMIVALAACGGDSEGDAREQLTKLGFTDKLADCVMDQIEDKAGSFSKFEKLSASEQQKMAANAGAECAKDASPDEIGDVVDQSGIGLDDKNARAGIIQGMTSQGVSEEMANCIVDKAVKDGLEMKDLLDMDQIQDLAEACQ